MYPNINPSIHKFIDYSLIFFPIALILGSPAVNLYLISYSIIFIYIFLYYRFFDWLKINWIRVFLLLWSYLIINSFFANDYYNSLRGSFSLIRFLLFALLIGFFGFKFLDIKKIAKYWLIIIAFVSIDLWIQFFFGKDLFGVESRFNRLSGPFGDELVVGGFIWKITMCIMPYIFYKALNDSLIKLKKYFLLIFFLISSVLITGERMSFLMYIFYFTLFFSLIFLNKKNKKRLLIFFSTFIILFSIFVSNIEIVKNRYAELFNIFSNFSGSSYGKLYVSGFEIWKKNPINGVGVKNFRIECDIQLQNREPLHHPLCSSHPHNLYLEILSETGIIGMILFLIFLFYIFKFFLINLSKKNLKNRFTSYALIISFIALVWPISTSGSFFTTWNGSFYWLVLGLLISNYNLIFSKY